MNCKAHGNRCPNFRSSQSTMTHNGKCMVLFTPTEDVVKSFDSVCLPEKIQASIGIIRRSKENNRAGEKIENRARHWLTWFLHRRWAKLEKITSPRIKLSIIETLPLLNLPKSYEYQCPLVTQIVRDHNFYNMTHKKSSCLNVRNSSRFYPCYELFVDGQWLGWAKTAKSLIKSPILFLLYKSIILDTLDLHPAYAYDRIVPVSVANSNCRYKSDRTCKTKMLTDSLLLDLRQETSENRWWTPKCEEERFRELEDVVFLENCGGSYYKTIFGSMKARNFLVSRNVWKEKIPGEVDRWEEGDLHIIKLNADADL